MNMQIRDFLQMENKCPDFFCTFVYKAKKKPFKCDLCSSYIGTIYHYRASEIMCRIQIDFVGVRRQKHFVILFIILNLMNIFIYKFIIKYKKYHVNN